MPKVEIYSSAHCPFCERAKSLLKKKNVAYQEIRVDTDDDKRAEMLARSQNMKTVPQIFINDQHIGGFDQLWALEQRNELDKLLEEK